MTTAIISDTHLYQRFNERKFDYLKDIFEKHDQVIINGDFWDGYICSFDRFVNSKWKKLFPYMKDKTIYVFGNHDREKWQDNKNLRFCKSAVNRYVHKLPNGSELIVEHGSPQSDKYFDKLTQRRFVVALSKPLYSLAIYEEILLTILFGWKGRELVLYSDRKKRTKMLSHATKELSKNGEVYVFSHTHFAIFDIVNKHINTGAIRFGLSSYLRVEDNDLKIISETY